MTIPKRAGGACGFVRFSSPSARTSDGSKRGARRRSDRFIGACRSLTAARPSARPILCDYIGVKSDDGVSFSAWASPIDFSGRAIEEIAKRSALRVRERLAISSDLFRKKKKKKNVPLVCIYEYICSTCVALWPPCRGLNRAHQLFEIENLERKLAGPSPTNLLICSVDCFRRPPVLPYRPGTGAPNSLERPIDQCYRDTPTFVSNNIGIRTEKITRKRKSSICRSRVRAKRDGKRK